MNFAFEEDLYTTAYRNDIFELLCICDKEFFPSLSSREDSRQMDLTNLKEDAVKPYSYFQKLHSQQFILLVNELNQCVAFMSFIHNYKAEELTEILPANYITTICVHPDYRRQGLLKKLYDYMLNNLPEIYTLPTVSTRTWSLNSHHISALHKIGFHVIRKLDDHRGPGIDTLYFAKYIGK